MESKPISFADKNLPQDSSDTTEPAKIQDSNNEEDVVQQEPEKTDDSGHSDEGTAPPAKVQPSSSKRSLSKSPNRSGADFSPRKKLKPRTKSTSSNASLDVEKDAQFEESEQENLSKEKNTADPSTSHPTSTKRALSESPKRSDESDTSPRKKLKSEELETLSTAGEISQEPALEERASTSQQPPSKRSLSADHHASSPRKKLKSVASRQMAACKRTLSRPEVATAEADTSESESRSSDVSSTRTGSTRYASVEESEHSSEAEGFATFKNLPIDSKESSSTTEDENIPGHSKAEISCSYQTLRALLRPREEGQLAASSAQVDEVERIRRRHFADAEAALELMQLPVVPNEQEDLGHVAAAPPDPEEAAEEEEEHVESDEVDQENQDPDAPLPSILQHIDLIMPVVPNELEDVLSSGGDSEEIGCSNPGHRAQLEQQEIPEIAAERCAQNPLDQIREEEGEAIQHPRPHLVDVGVQHFPLQEIDHNNANAPLEEEENSPSSADGGYSGDSNMVTSPDGEAAESESDEHRPGFAAPHPSEESNSGDAPDVLNVVNVPENLAAPADINLDEGIDTTASERSDVSSIAPRSVSTASDHEHETTEESESERTNSSPGESQTSASNTPENVEEEEEGQRTVSNTPEPVGAEQRLEEENPLSPHSSVDTVSLPGRKSGSSSRESSEEDEEGGRTKSVTPVCWEDRLTPGDYKQLAEEAERRQKTTLNSPKDPVEEEELESEGQAETHRTSSVPVSNSPGQSHRSTPEHVTDEEKSERLRNNTPEGVIEEEQPQVEVMCPTNSPVEGQRSPLIVPEAIAEEEVVNDEEENPMEVSSTSPVESERHVSSTGLDEGDSSSTVQEVESTNQGYEEEIEEPTTSGLLDASNKPEVDCDSDANDVSSTSGSPCKKPSSIYFQTDTSDSNETEQDVVIDDAHGRDIQEGSVEESRDNIEEPSTTSSTSEGRLIMCGRGSSIQSSNDVQLENVEIEAQGTSFETSAPAGNSDVEEIVAPTEISDVGEIIVISSDESQRPTEEDSRSPISDESLLSSEYQFRTIFNREADIARGSSTGTLAQVSGIAEHDEESDISMPYESLVHLGLENMPLEESLYEGNIPMTISPVADCGFELQVLISEREAEIFDNSNGNSNNLRDSNPNEESNVEMDLGQPELDIAQIAEMNIAQLADINIAEADEEVAEFYEAEDAEIVMEDVPELFTAEAGQVDIVEASDLNVVQSSGFGNVRVDDDSGSSLGRADSRSSIERPDSEPSLDSETSDPCLSRKAPSV